MPHRDIVDASVLHNAKARYAAGSPQFNVGPQFDEQVYVDDDSGVIYVADGGLTRDCWRMATEQTKRLPTLMGNFMQEQPGGGPRFSCPPIGSLVLHSGSVQSSQPAGGYENDGGRYVSYATVDISTATDPVFRLYVQIPPDFAGWDSAGIQLRNRVSDFTSASNTLDPMIEVLDPATGASFGTPKTGTRNVSSTEGSYTTTQISGAALGAGYSAGDLMIVEFSLLDTDGSAVDASWRLAWLRINWN